MMIFRKKNSFQNPAENSEFLADFRRFFSGNWGGFRGTGIRAAEQPSSKIHENSAAIHGEFG
jgi:hypothetical protein